MSDRPYFGAGLSAAPLGPQPTKPTEPLSWDEFQANKAIHTLCRVRLKPGTNEVLECIGWHCSFCGVSCGDQGHFGCEYKGLYPVCTYCDGAGAFVVVQGENEWDEYNCPECVGD